MPGVIPLKYATHPGFKILLFVASLGFRFEYEPPSAAFSLSQRCVRPAQPDHPSLALYSLTESAGTPFHAEPTQEQIEGYGAAFR